MQVVALVVDAACGIQSVVGQHGDAAQPRVQALSQQGVQQLVAAPPGTPVHEDDHRRQAFTGIRPVRSVHVQPVTTRRSVVQVSVNARWRPYSAQQLTRMSRKEEQSAQDESGEVEETEKAHVAQPVLQ